MSSSKTNICFRCDGNSQIGLGHVYRCLALAEFLEEQFNIIFVIRQSSNKTIIPSSYGVLEIPDELEINSEIQFFANAFGSEETTFVIDGYQFDENYISSLKKLFKLVYIDDLHNFNIHADLIINHTGGFERNNFKALALTQFCLGPDFAIIRNAFLNKQRSENFKFDLLICFGGADPENFTLRVLQESDPSKKIAIIVGTAYQFKKELISNSSPNVTVLDALNAIELADVMSESKTAITSASTVSYEFLAASTGKLYLIQTAENQKYLFQFLLESGAAKSYSLSLDQDWSSTKIIDGKAPERFLKEFKLLEHEMLSRITPASEKYIQEVFNWANDDEVRRQSFSQEKIEFGDHEKWFLNKINDKNSNYYLICFNGKAVGQIRFEIENTDATISFLVSPDERSKGWGGIILKKGILQLQIDRSEIKTVNGYVKHNNLASQKSFLRCNFKEENADDRLHSFFYTLEL